MGTLSSCLKKIGLSKHEAAILRGATDDNIKDGDEAHVAAVRAVADYIEQLEKERAAIVAQVDKAGGVSPDAPFKLADLVRQTSVLRNDSPANMGKDAEADTETYPKAESLELNDRNSFTLERLNRETNKMEPVTFERGEYVTYAVGGKAMFGEIDGISHAKREFSVDGLWYPFGFAYKSEKPAEDVAKTVPMSEVIDAVNAKHGDGVTEADRIATVEGHKEFYGRLLDGEVSIDEFKAHFASILKSRDMLTAELGKMTKDALLNLMGGYKASRYKSERKDRVVGEAYRSMLDDFVLGDSISFGFGAKYEDVISNYVNGYSQENIDQFAEKVKQRRIEADARVEQKIAGIKDQQTLDDFRAYMQAKTADGTTYQDARLTLTVEQRAKFDELVAEYSRSARKSSNDRQVAPTETAQTTTGQVVATKHTKTGDDLFVVQAADRVDRDIYNQWNAVAKKLGGYYSSFKGNGAIPGFTFKSRENAESFLQYLGGDATSAKEAAQAKRDAYADDRSQTAVERLNEMADRLEENANDSLGRDRKANTERRARLAGAAEAAAESDKAMAVTMRNIAMAIHAGTAKFLDKVRQKVQVEMLRSALSSAKYDEVREKYPTDWSGKQRYKDPVTVETVDYAKWPNFTAFRSDLANLGRELLAIDGAKRVGQAVLKVADDVTDAYKKFAKDNLNKVSTFKTKDGMPAIFTTSEDAEKAIARSGYKGKATTISFKRGSHLVIMGPQMAKEAGIWQGDDDQRITLSPELGEEIVAIKKKHGKLISSMPYIFDNVSQNSARWKALGIESPPEMRAALREFVGLMQAPKEADKIKQMERAMIGRKNDGLDFFPTPRDVVNEMIEAADIQQGMSVLEPSAGMAHIADQIREAGVEPDVVELSSDRRELLTEKGYKLVGNDFTEVAGEYDRIIMNPPFGDRRDASHVQHAYSLLKPGGRIVAIMGEGVFFGQDKKAKEFREWLESVGGTSEKVQDGAFMDSSLPVNTGASARMVVIDKAADSADRMNSQANDDSMGGDAPATLSAAPSGNDRNAAVVVDAVAANDAIASAMSGLEGAPSVTLVDSFSDLPQQIQDEAQEQDAGEREFKGAFKSGHIWILRANHATVDDIEATLFHELYGHYGTRALFGNKWMQEINKLYASVGGWPGVKAIAEKRGIKLEDYRNGVLNWDGDKKIWRDPVMMEELLAHIAEQQPNQKLRNRISDGIKRLVGTFRQWLRDKGFAQLAQRGETDLLHILAQASQAVREGKSVKSGPAFSVLSKSSYQSDTIDVDGVQRHRLNSEGKPIYPTDDGIRNFWRWIDGTNEQRLARATGQSGNAAGDAGLAERNSAVGMYTFDGEGRPRVFYHGSSSDFTAFDLDHADRKDHGWLGRGVYVTSDSEIAGTYANLKRGNSGENIMPMYIALHNPLIADVETKQLFRNRSKQEIDAWTEKAIANGYDGVILEYARGSIEAVAFSNTAVKSATGNNGNFDPNEAPIMMSRSVSETLADQVEIVKENLKPKNIKDWLKAQLTQRRPFMMGFLTLDQIADLYGKKMGSVSEFANEVQAMDTEKQRITEGADKIVERWRQLKEGEADQLADVMHEATLIQYDPDLYLPDDSIADGHQPMAFSGQDKPQESLYNKFIALSPEAQQIYRDTRDSYKKTIEQVRDGLANRVERSGSMGGRIAAEIRLEFDGYLEQGPYFPLARFGDFILVSDNGKVDGRIVESFESVLERDKMKAQRIKEGYKASEIKETTKQAYSSVKDGAAGKFAQDVLKHVSAMDMDAEAKAALMDDLNQLAITNLPDQSYRKHFMHRKGVAGFSKDAMRAFANGQFHAAHHIAKINHADKLSFLIDEIMEEARATKSGDVTEPLQVANELKLRLDDIVNPKTGPVAAAAGQLGFVMSLGGNLASGVTNLTQTPLITFPWLGSKFGFDKAASAMTKASKDYFGGKWDKWSGYVMESNPSLTDNERKMLKALQDGGKIDLTQAHDLASVANQNSAQSKGAYARSRAMKIIGWTFHLPEVFNRQVSALAAYRLATGSGMSHNDAINYASKTLDRTHFNYSSSNRARFMNGDFMRVLTMFKQYSQQMTYLLWRNAYQALKGESPEVRREARRMLAGVLTMQFMAAGSLGLPLGAFGISTILLPIAAMSLGDGDDPWEWEVEYRKMLADVFGTKGGEVIAHGALRSVIPWADFASRVGMGDLWFRPPAKELEGRAEVEAWMQTLAGPVVGYVGNVGTAAKLFSEGNMTRGVEAMLPKMVSAPLKAIRYATDGVQSMKGDDLGIRLDPADIAFTAAGFNPSDVAEMYEARNAIKNREHVLTLRRKQLINQWHHARKAGDTEGVADAMADIGKFNKANSDTKSLKITPGTLAKSSAMQERNAKQIRMGAYLTKGKESLREEGAFADVNES